MGTSGPSRSVANGPGRIAVATIAGSDPSGGAGLQRDLKTFEAHGCDGTAVVTALTVQDRHGVHDVRPLDGGFVAAQLDVVLEEFRPRAVKTGMLWNAEVIEAVAARLAKRGDVLLVVDPVLAATSGGELLRPDSLPALRDCLIPLADVVTPNLPEAARLLGMREVPADGLSDAATRILSFGCRAVVLKGGHGSGPEAIDLLATPGALQSFALPRVNGVRAHGTGCALSAAMVCHLASGKEVGFALSRAKAFVHRSLVDVASP